jgi:hypothetical protein
LDAGNYYSLRDTGQGLNRNNFDDTYSSYVVPGTLLKGQSHKKVGEMRVETDSLGPN